MERYALLMDEQGGAGSDQGFTLLEVLISLTIVALAVTVYFQLFSAGMKLEFRSEQKVKAAVQAQQFFERLQCLDVREDDFAWQGHDGECAWDLQIHPREVQTQEWTEDDISITLDTELYTYTLTYRCPDEQPLTFERTVVVSPDFFSDQFKNEHFDLP